MESLIPEISHLLNNTISPDKTLVSAAADRLDRLSSQPGFLLSLLAITTVGDSQGLKIAAAIYLKNFFRRHEADVRASSGQYIEFRNQLAQTLLQVDSSVLKVLVEAFLGVITTDFVKENCWPDLIPELRSVIQNSKLIRQSPCSQWKTINALIVLQTTIRPFQYFLNPKVPKEPVPSQLELIAEDILVPLQATFHLFVDKALSCPDRIEMENEEVLLIICKCIYFSVRSYMPSALRFALPTYCNDWFRVLDSLSLGSALSGDGHLLRLKVMKRILAIFCALVTRHRKHCDKLMPNILKCAIKIVKQSPNNCILGALPERIVSLAFDVISHVLETGPGWRLVSPHFSSLLELAIFPAVALNQKDVSEWEEDADEYLRKNLPSDLDDITGLAEDFFTARKSALNLLGVIAMSKGPPVVSTASKHKKRDRNKKKECHSSVGELLVVPFLSKFSIPCGGEEFSSKILKEYYGVLMAYGGLQDFFKGRSSEYIHSLLQSRVLPIFSLYPCSPFLLSTANWLLGELACCLPQALSANIYNSLTKTLTWSDDGDFNYYPVRVSAAGAITELINNEYFPPDWTPLLQILVSRMGIGDEIECCLLFNLLSTVVEAGQDKVAVHIPVVVSNIANVILRNMPPIPEPWPQVLERGFAVLAELALIWESSLPDNIQQPENREWRSGWASIAELFSNLLQKAWFMPVIKDVDDHKLAVPETFLPCSCIDDACTLLGFVMRFITERDEVTRLKIPDLLTAWSALIADWDLWEEMEDQTIFSSILEAVNLQKKFDLQILFSRKIPSANSPPGSKLSNFECICSFVSGAIKAYPSAVWRACSCIHSLLHVPSFSYDAESIKHAMAITFARAAFSRFMDIHEKPIGLWKPLLLVISSCYFFYSKDIEQVLEKEADKGFIIWASALAHISTSSFTPGLSTESELVLCVATLTKVVERLLVTLLDRGEVLRVSFMALLDAFTRMKEVQEGNEEAEVSDAEESEDDADDDDDDDDDEEDSEEEQLVEETEDEFLDRYAKAAADLENEMVDEGDIEDDVQELELGVFEEMNLDASLLQLIQSHRPELMGGQDLSPTVLNRLISCFPEQARLFQLP
ncbi:uncharacterized protein LOC110019929 isoform X4 [Phalaenopsis equestris]|uniref:uncharacterized protein LOC110019929 isoform X3 n=1 Tax=Phalaenopsis equestris TaxID=78828 RepID=UPI0009E519DA|nr:uncharacterized protein LOC110019929 isoform X3 [Phalaenopsis equestris]XP_020573468.1 uncharacterized protein LOC110019929 isoform X4 [Phalaenopsis equestris]